MSISHRYGIDSRKSTNTTTNRKFSPCEILTWLHTMRIVVTIRLSAEDAQSFREWCAMRSAPVARSADPVVEYDEPAR